MRRARRGEREPTLLRAVLSFIFAIALIVFLFFVVGHFHSLDSDDNGSALRGTYMPGLPSGEKPPPVFAAADYAVRFLDEDRVELRVNGGFRDGYYHIERDHVFIETAETRGPNLSLNFKIDGERLVGSGVVLWRQVR